MSENERIPTNGNGHPTAADRPRPRPVADPGPWAEILKYVIKPTPDPSTWIFPKRGTPPPEMAGKWVAWSADMQTIVASGDTIAEARGQIPDGEVVSYQYVPRR